MPSQKASLPPTLALRVQHLRHERNLTALDLANRAHIPLQMLQDIEAGIELFLSWAVRQRLARCLRVRPDCLLEVEKRFQSETPESFPSVNLSFSQELSDAVFQNPQRKYFCPQCGALLKVRIFERRDLENNMLLTAKINCTQCLFRMEANP